MEEAMDGDSLDVGPLAGPWLEDEAADDTELTLGEVPALAEEDLEPTGAGGRRLRRDIFRWREGIGELYQLLIQSQQLF